jgi:hypothetical protein
VYWATFWVIFGGHFPILNKTSGKGQMHLFVTEKATGKQLRSGIQEFTEKNFHSPNSNFYTYNQDWQIFLGTYNIPNLEKYDKQPPNTNTKWPLPRCTSLL